MSGDRFEKDLGRLMLCELVRSIGDRVSNGRFGVPTPLRCH
jgi:hypothetical protein